MSISDYERMAHPVGPLARCVRCGVAVADLRDHDAFHRNLNDLAPTVRASTDYEQPQWIPKADGYHVELGTQRFTQEQWEAVDAYVAGRAAADTQDAATETIAEFNTRLRTPDKRSLPRRVLIHEATDRWMTANGYTDRFIQHLADHIADTLDRVDADQPRPTPCPQCHQYGSHKLQCTHPDALAHREEVARRMREQ